MWCDARQSTAAATTTPAPEPQSAAFEQARSCLDQLILLNAARPCKEKDCEERIINYRYFSFILHMYRYTCTCMSFIRLSNLFASSSFLPRTQYKLTFYLPTCMCRPYRICNTHPGRISCDHLTSHSLPGISC